MRLGDHTPAQRCRRVIEQPSGGGTDGGAESWVYGV